MQSKSVKTLLKFMIAAALAASSVDKQKPTSYAFHM